MDKPGLTITTLLTDPDNRVQQVIKKFSSLNQNTYEWKSVGQWLKYGVVNYGLDKKTGKPHNWELVERTTRNSAVDGVDILAVVRSVSLDIPYIVLVINHRPPVGNVCIEFPAGLVDLGESVEQTAIRELKEETGFIGKTVRTSPILHVDPWKSNETTVMVEMEIDGDDPANAGALNLNLDDQENVEPLLVPRQGLLERLHRYRELGLFIDAKLYTIALGWSMCPQ